jgi:hypothetical protein
MNVMSALIGIHNFQVQHVSYDGEIARNTVSTQHVSGIPSNLKRFATGISLNQTD